jgi:hypothetical protein
VVKEAIMETLEDLRERRLVKEYELELLDALIQIIEAKEQAK